MKRLDTVFITAALLLNPMAPTLAYAAIYLQGAEVNANTLIQDAYVAVTYYDSKNKQKLDKGWIDVIDETTFQIRSRALFGKKTIAYDKVMSVIMSERETLRGKQINEVERFIREMEKREARAKDNRSGLGLMFEVGWNWGINTSSQNIFSGYAYYLDHGQKLHEGLPWSLSFYFGRMISGERSQRFGLKYTRQVVQILPINLHNLPPAPRSGKTYWSSSLLLVYQRVVKRSPYVVMLADIAGGVALINDYFNSRPVCNELNCLPEMGSRYSAGMAFLLPIYAHIGLQATVRADLLVIKNKYPFTSGMSMALGILWQ